MILKTILVEDEPLSRLFLHNLLKEFCPQISVVAVAATETAAVQLIREHQPDLVFLDIELQEGTGFGVLQHSDVSLFQVIFTTALDQEAINIIRMSGVDYLQKPIDIEGLQAAILNVYARMQSVRPALALEHLLQTLNAGQLPSHIQLDASDPDSYIPLLDIVRAESKDGGCYFTMKNGNKQLADKSLKEYESLLAQYAFFRTHQHHLVNISEIKDLNRNSELQIVMSNGDCIPLSEKRQSALMNRMEAG